MTRYHVNDQGNPGKCRAKTAGNCPFGGTEDHYDTQQEAASAYEKSQTEKTFQPLNKNKSHPATDQALSSTLKYSGRKPRWMKDHEKLSEKLYGTKPEIIDTLETSEGTVAVIWSQNSIAATDVSIQMSKGFEVSMIQYRHMKTGEKLGHIKTAYVTEESYRRSFGNDEFADFKSYQSNSSGFYGFNREMREPGKDAEGRNLVYFEAESPYSESDSEEERVDAKRKFWVEAHKGMDVFPKDFDATPFGFGGLVNLNKDHAPESEKELDADIEKLKTKAVEETGKFKRSYQVPHIDYSIIEDKLRGQGLGLSLYVYSARQLAKQDKVLSSSNLQTPEAKGVWKRIQDDKRIPVKQIQTTHEDEESSSTSDRLTIDFREQGSNKSGGLHTGEDK